eukprot:EG_transcript_5650
MLLPQFVRNRLTFFRVHFLYFVLLGLLGAVLIYAIEDEVPFIDALFMAVSASTLTGLTTRDISVWSLNSQAILFLLIGLGSQIVLTTVPIALRRYYYRRGLQQSVVYGIPRLYDHARQTEYRALGVMMWIIFGWFFGVTLVSHLLLSLYFWNVRRDVFDHHALNPGWFALFHSVSVLNNCGMCLLASSLMEFQTDYFVLIWSAALTLVGDTFFPVVLRFTVWALHRAFPRDAAFKYLLDHPRRCCTHLFPGPHTRILIAFNVVFTLIQYVCFMSLEFNRRSLNMVPGHVRSLLAGCQTIYTRTTGINAIDMSALSPPMLIVLWIMMYISSYPIIASVRQASDQQAADAARNEEGTIGMPQKDRDTTVAGRVKKSCTDDLPMLIVGLFIITVVEEDLILANTDETIFAILFEVTSAYGPVGLSLGYPGTVTALSGVFHPISKLVIMLIMICGRHRGLPQAINHSVDPQKVFSAWPQDLEPHWASVEPDPASPTCPVPPLATGSATATATPATNGGPRDAAREEAAPLASSSWPQRP